MYHHIFILITKFIQFIQFIPQFIINKFILIQFIHNKQSIIQLLLDIINDILDVAKIEAGKMELDLSVVQLNELFEDVSNKTRRQALARNLLYEITPPKTHDEVIV